ncbi:hypothetical protein PoMZ_05209 [Pyricularia oryzae]|uniref:DUF159 domain protein n=1 Tax=Pyricularia oryzae TaxID=318829 RepID=A0A4P7NMR7_PYROR|nr:hypothetical protein PoMZ_05209 [Pyricularia oryzae]
MCGRYALALRPDQIRQRLRANNMPVWEDPEDDIYEIGDGAGGENNNDESAPAPAPTPSQGQPRQSYNFAPGYYGVVYRADTPDWGAGPRKGEDEDKDDSDQEQSPSTDQPHYKLQAMKWGLIPFWTKRNPDYSSMMKTINCRDDSLAANGGMWNTMKARKRCIVIAEGFYEWLKVGPKERVPYYIKRKDGGLLLLAGLWDCVKYENDDRKHYTYTIITTDSNKSLKFLHDRMPVILEPASDDLNTWLNPKRHEWNKELQSILKPWDGDLEIYAVSKDVNKVGNSSSSFIVPVASKENKNNIANFFANASGAKKDATKGAADTKAETKSPKPNSSQLENQKGLSTTSTKTPVKRPADVGPLNPDEEPPQKKQATIQTSSPTKKSTAPEPRKTISATSNRGKRSPTKSKVDSAGTQKITKFFSK